LGNPRLTNTVMLGAAAEYLPFGVDVMRQCVLSKFRRKPDLLDLNLQAFEAGRDATRTDAAA
ncbi:MAG: 2-oxoacid:acceptor oxidoreductase family protein, partial [Rhodospirillales bacterium]|nr:2-oxoacid:acceptor oxidoreductase family protein [Rhodospirillales bacterium]